MAKETKTKNIIFTSLMIEKIRKHGRDQGYYSFSESVRDLIRIGLGETKTQNQKKATGMIDTKKAARLLGITDRHIRRLCVTGKLAGSIKPWGKWEIPVAANPRLSGVK